jgi:hypothetical protein
MPTSIPSFSSAAIRVNSIPLAIAVPALILLDLLLATRINGYRDIADEIRERGGRHTGSTYNGFLKRRWNIPIWAGFAIVVLSLISYIPVFALFPITRDVPWVNYMLFVLGGVLLAIGLKHAYREPDRYRGKISGPVLSMLSLLIAGFFVLGILVLTKQLPASSGAPHVGHPAPQFTLANIDGKQIALADLLKGHQGVILIFYRGYW